MRLPILPILALSTALALAGCGSGKTVTASNESVSDVAKKVADAGLKFTPGRWDSTMKFVKLEMDGMPPEAKAMMSKVMGKDVAPAAGLFVLSLIVTLLEFAR